jgi:hypothetical protein
MLAFRRFGDKVCVELSEYRHGWHCCQAAEYSNENIAGRILRAESEHG